MMKALSVRQPFATLIGLGDKTIEWRSWKTEYRGPVLIVASNHKFRDEELGILPHGVAICVTSIINVRPWQASDSEAAAIYTSIGNGYAFDLGPVHEVKPVPVKGKMGIFEVNIVPEWIDDEDSKGHIEYWLLQ